MPRWRQNQNKDRYKNANEGMSTEEIFGAVSGGIGALSGLALINSSKKPYNNNNNHYKLYKKGTQDL